MLSFRFSASNALSNQIITLFLHLLGFQEATKFITNETMGVTATSDKIITNLIDIKVARGNRRVVSKTAKS